MENSKKRTIIGAAAAVVVVIVVVLAANLSGGSSGEKAGNLALSPENAGLNSEVLLRICLSEESNWMPEVHRSYDPAEIRTGAQPISEADKMNGLIYNETMQVPFAIKFGEKSEWSEQKILFSSQLRGDILSVSVFPLQALQLIAAGETAVRARVFPDHRVQLFNFDDWWCELKSGLPYDDWKRQANSAKVKENKDTSDRKTSIKTQRTEQYNSAIAELNRKSKSRDYGRYMQMIKNDNIVVVVPKTVDRVLVNDADGSRYIQIIAGTKINIGPMDSKSEGCQFVVRISGEDKFGVISPQKLGRSSCEK